MATRVIFRKYSDGEIIALFPAVAWTNSPHTCACYAQIGQHGEASPSLVESTKLATPDEYAPLRRELERLGYDDLVIAKRFTQNDFCKRCEQCIPI